MIQSIVWRDLNIHVWAHVCLLKLYVDALYWTIRLADRLTGELLFLSLEKGNLVTCNHSGSIDIGGE